MSPHVDGSHTRWHLTLALALALLALAAYGGGTGSLGSDVWWHIRLGETIVETGDISPKDTFSYTFSGQPQRNSEWLADVAIYTAYSLGGASGLACLRIAILFVTLLLLSRLAMPPLRGAWPAYVAVFLALAILVFGLRVRLHNVRPYLFSFLFFSSTMYAASLWHRQAKWLRVTVYSVIILLWANTSNGVVFAPLALGSQLPWSLRMPFRRLLLMSALVFGCFALTLVNPDGITTLTKLLTARASSIGKLSERILEHRTLFAVMQGHLWRDFALPIFSLIVAVICAFTLARGREWKQGILLTAFTAGAVFSNRLIGFALISAAPILMQAVGTLALAARRSRLPGSPLIFMTPALVLLIASLVINPRQRIIDFSAGTLSTYPHGAVAFVREHRLPPRMFNNYNASSYLIWHLPEYKVFIDSRSWALYDGTHYDAYRAMNILGAEWGRAVKRWGISFVLLHWDIQDINMHSDSSEDYPQHLDRNPDWPLVYWDDKSAVYVNSAAVPQSFLDEHSYRITRPSLTHYEDFKARRVSDRDGLLRDLDHDVQLNWQNQEPMFAKAYLLLDDDSPAALAEKIRLLSRCVRLPPDLALEHAMLSKALFESGELDAAAREARAALLLNRKNTIALDVAAKLGLTHE